MKISHLNNIPWATFDVSPFCEKCHATFFVEKEGKTLDVVHFERPIAIGLESVFFEDGLLEVSYLDGVLLAVDKWTLPASVLRVAHHVVIHLKTEGQKA